MADKTIRIRVGASADASLRDVFRPIEEAARRSRKVVASEMGAAGKDGAAAAKRGADASEQAFAKLARDAGKWQRQAVSDVERGERAKTRAVEREAAARAKAEERSLRDQERAYARSVREIQAGRRHEIRTLDRQFAAADRATALDTRRSNAFAGRLGMGLLGGGRMALSFASRTAGSIARGEGIDLDLSSHVQKNTDLEKRALELSNAGYMAGAAGPNGVRQDAGALMSQARAVGTATGFSANEALEGLQAFVAKTGDLQLGRDVLKDMAVLSKATGASLENMVDASADVAMNLGDVKDKGAVTVELMKAFAGMGKEGAVEVKDLSKQMAGLAAVAGMFGGDRAGNIAMMGALAQEARQRGGSKSAAQAVTGVGSFVNTFSKAARNKAFKAFGVQTQGVGGLRSAQDIIIDSIVAASSAKNGGMAAMNENMGKMFMDVRARGTTRGFENIYRDAGGGAAGVQALQDEFARLKNAAMGAGEVMDSFKRAMGSTESQSAILNNQLSEMAQQLTAIVNPALKEFAPILIGAAKSFLGWVTENLPGHHAAELSTSNDLQIRTAHNAGILRDDLRKGIVDQKHIDAASEDLKLLETEQAKAHAAVRTSYDEVHHGFAIGDDVQAQKQHLAENQRNEAGLEEAHDTLRAAISGAQNNGLGMEKPTGPMEVIVKSMPRPPISHPSVDPHGVTPGVTRHAPGR